MKFGLKITMKPKIKNKKHRKEKDFLVFDKFFEKTL